MGVEADRRVASFVWIDGAGRFAASAEWKVLAIRTRGGAGPERRGERLRLLRLHDPRQGAAVGLLSQMPSRRPDQLLVAGDGTGLGHAGEAEIGGIRQHRGEHHPAVIRRQIGPEMGEAVAEPGPAGDLIEKVGDADARQQSVKPGGQRLGCFRCDRLKRRDLERRAADPDILQLVLASLVGDLAQPLVKKFPPSSKPGGGVEWHRDRKRSGLFHGGEQRLRDELVLNRPGSADFP